MRPGVVWFGESLPQASLDEAVSVCQHADILFVVGTSGLVHPAAALPALAKESGACVIEINPEPTPLSELAEHHLREKAGVALVAILESLP